LAKSKPKINEVLKNFLADLRKEVKEVEGGSFGRPWGKRGEDVVSSLGSSQAVYILEDSAVVVFQAADDGDAPISVWSYSSVGNHDLADRVVKALEPSRLEIDFQKK